MGLSLLLPLGLAALAALLIPLLLHLHRRQEQQATLFAALRWIRGPAKPRRRIQLEQWPLLLLRLVLLALQWSQEKKSAGERSNKTRAAEVLGISRARLTRRLRELGLDPGEESC